LESARPRNGDGAGKLILLDIFIAAAGRLSFVYAEYGTLELDGHAVVLHQAETFTHIPVSSTSVIMVMPGTVVTHAAVRVCAEEGCLLLWVGEHGVRCYASGNPGRNSDALLRQASLALNPNTRLHAAKAIFREMFDEEAPQARSVDQLRGMEGARVRALYQKIASEHGIQWKGRDQKSALSDPLNQAISGANAALYGITEAVILAMGYAPSIGVVHSGDPRSFVFDIADCLKFKTVVPMAMRVYSESTEGIEGRIRRSCRDLFQEKKMAKSIVDVIDRVIPHAKAFSL